MTDRPHSRQSAGVAGRRRHPLRAVLLGLALATGAAGLPTTAAGEPRVIVYPKPANPARWDYALQLIGLALDRAGLDYVLEPTGEVLAQARAARELELGNIDLIWAGTSAEYESRFRPVRIPVMRGLLGYRICLIRAADRAAFAAIDSLDAFRGMTIGQGDGWSDVTILEAAGFEVVTGPAQTMLAMLDGERFDCFLRGVHEAPGEIAATRPAHPDLAMESEVMLVYPIASFFFVNRDDAALAEALESGLERAYDDGSFMALFRSHPAVQAVFAEATIDRRRRFDIGNPLLTPETLAIPDRYWYGRDGSDGSP